MSAFITILALTLAPLAAPADEVAPIYGGEIVDTCAWPTTVSFSGECTGTLIHPELVVYAWHCGAAFTEIVLGEDFNTPQRTVPISYCETRPDGGPGTGQDIAYCRLAEPILDVPIVPVLMGCETDALTIGRKTAIVGFGVAEDGEPFGPKRAVTTPIVQWFGEEIFIGGDGKDSCNGDSGGPVYIRTSSTLDPGGDGTWRVFGVTSYGAPCGEGGYYTVIHKNMEWLESASGLDLTPCHEADGTWAPGPRCGGFPLESELAQGTWEKGCSGGKVGGMSATCGAPFPGTPDATPPSVAITAPGDGSVFVSDAKLGVYISAEAEDKEWGLQDVHLRINGQDVPGTAKTAGPFEYIEPLLEFSPGTWELQAVARDLAGNEASSAVVTIHVVPQDEVGGSTDAPTTSDTSSSASSSGEGSSSSGGASGEGKLDDDSLCGCSGGEGGALGLLVLLGLRRRRRS